MTQRNWRASAACRPGQGIDSELFFPIGDSGPALLQAAEAKAVCRGCAVREQCLAWAVDNLPVGIAGGLDERERKALRRRVPARSA